MKNVVTAWSKEIHEFDRFLPGYSSISDMKKLDFMLWGVNREA